jgi:hypothetical protein
VVSLNINQLLRGLVGSAQQPVDAKSIELKVGEVVKGVVLQLLAEQDALVNIGGVPLRARLETPLQAGQMTLLQVQPESSNGQIVLKPLGSTNVQILESSLADVIKSLGMKDTEANRSLVQQLHAAGIPLNAKTLKAFQPIGNMSPVNHIPQDQWTEAAIVAYKKGLPLKSEIILPLQQVMFGKGLPQSLEQLKGSLQRIIQLAIPNDKNSDHMALIRKLIDTINSLSTNKVTTSPNSQDQGGKVTNQAANSSQQVLNQAGRPILPNESGMVTTKQGAIAQPLTQASSTSTTQAAPQASQQASPRVSPQANLTSTPGVSNAQAPASTATLPTTQAPSATPASAHIAVTLPPVASATAPLIATVSANSAANPTTVTLQPSPPVHTELAPAANFTPRVAGNEHGQAASIQGNQGQNADQLLRGAELIRSGEATSGANDPWIKQLLKQLGVDHEHRAANLFTQSANAPDADELQFRHETVKGLLLQLVNSDQLPQAVKDAAQQIVQQITGQQLLLGAERGSPFSLVTLFVPIKHENGTDTASVHIQSKRKQGGHLDADNCRLLFDLRMSTLGDTLVDVQVMNRIVSLQVHNDFPLIGKILDSLKPEIEAAMNEIGFQFISLKNVPYPNPTTGRMGEGDQASELRSAVSNTYHSKPYKGVDLKV